MIDVLVAIALLVGALLAIVAVSLLLVLTVMVSASLAERIGLMDWISTLGERKRERRTESMTMAQAFNEWMRRYIEEPERFEREWKAIETFKREEAAGQEPSYGELCTAYLQGILDE